MNLNIFTAQKELTQAQADNETLIKRLAEKETELEQARDTFQTLSQEKQSHDQFVNTLKDEHKIVLDGLIKQLEEAKQSAGKEAVKLVAQMGVEVGTVKETISAVQTTDAQILETLKSLSGPARTAYYNEHKARILSLSGFKQ